MRRLFHFGTAIELFDKCVLLGTDFISAPVHNAIQESSSKDRWRRSQTKSRLFREATIHPSHNKKNARCNTIDLLTWQAVLP